jgi:hypothetical protein
MQKGTLRAALAFALAVVCTRLLAPAVRGSASVYVGGTIAGMDNGEKGKLDTQAESLVFSPDKGKNMSIPYIQITAMDYGEHVGRRVAAAIIVAWPLLFSHKKRHYLTIYFNQDPAKAAAERDQLAKDPKASATGDVAAFEINKHDFTNVMDVLQAKTGLKARLEEVSH